ncbi:MAG: HD domain-containing protein [Actinobacteria bacterium]|nr:HD domain-containing protein [Cyanobacteriota bacterium]MCL5771215.1 HD domain-containing protein [Actinomycetota bacterium]
MDRQYAYELVIKLIKNKNLIKHSLAVEAIMRDLALDLNKKNSNYNNYLNINEFDEDKWAIAGLVHDIDYEETADDPLRHSLIGEKILKENGFEEDIIYAVKVHNDAHGLPLISKMDIALFASDPVSGLIVASALINPERKIKLINKDFVLNRYKEKSFARGVNRAQILACEKLGYNLEEFIDIALKAMQKIDKEIGL